MRAVDTHVTDVRVSRTLLARTDSHARNRMGACFVFPRAPRVGVGGDSSESDGDADAVRRLCDKCLFSCWVTRC
jgi:hypothetical protein